MQSSYGSLVDHVFHDADGLPNQIEYGDLAKTTTDFGHDDRRRLQSVQTTRGPPGDWTSPPVNYSPAPQYGQVTPTNFQLILEDAEFLYDNVDNPIELRDWRAAGEWPSGAKPVTRKVEYDDLYRVSQVDYQYSKGDDTWTDPFDNEDTGANTDTRRAAPSPHVSFAKRALKETFGYDWLGNTTKTGDDANGFYDRSLGDITNDASKPYQLKSATNESTASPRDGHLDTKYDDAGNLTNMALTRAGPCLPSTAHCNQRFAYEWDEVGRLVRARRWDQQNSGVAADPVPNTMADVELRYAYDGGDQRVLKTAVDASSNERHSVYSFASLELRRAAFTSGDYVDDKNTEVAYLFAHGVRIARLHYSAESLPTLTSGKLHVLLELPDHLGSSAIVIDRETGELVERSTYLAQGSADSDYRSSRWDSFREDYRFTGKEDDVEVGLKYFGARYLAPGLGRWMSADPLAVHLGGSDANAYAYVRGQLLRATDPLGLLSTDEGLGATLEERHQAMKEALPFAGTFAAKGAMLVVCGAFAQFIGESEAGAPENARQAAAVKPHVSNTTVALNAASGVVGGRLVGKGVGVVIGEFANASAQPAAAITTQEVAQVAPKALVTETVPALSTEANSATNQVVTNAHPNTPSVAPASPTNVVDVSSSIPNLEGSVWSLDWKSRGYAIEHVLAGNDGVPTTNFKVIDAWSNGNAVSIKSLDLSLKSYQPPDAVRGKIYEYIDKLAPYPTRPPPWPWGRRRVRRSANQMNFTRPQREDL